MPSRWQHRNWRDFAGVCASVPLPWPHLFAYCLFQRPVRYVSRNLLPARHGWMFAPSAACVNGGQTSLHKEVRMPTCVMHIGATKTGSKYLQTSLAALAGELLKDGICYPTTLFSPKPQVWHRGLATLLQQGRSTELENIFHDLGAGGYRYVCFSNEGFWRLSEEQLLYLRELLSGFEIRIVHYCRRWSERIPSLWKQNVKEGFVVTFPEYLSRAIRAPLIEIVALFAKSATREASRLSVAPGREVEAINVSVAYLSSIESTSKLRLAAGAECVSNPEDRKSAPVSA